LVNDENFGNVRKLGIWYRAQSLYKRILHIEKRNDCYPDYILGFHVYHQLGDAIEHIGKNYYNYEIVKVQVKSPICVGVSVR